jgi:Fur family zinc uptake transcriptional regulator
MRPPKQPGKKVSAKSRSGKDALRHPAGNGGETPPAEWRGQSRRVAAFPTPDHDHDRCLDEAMALAQARCAERGQRLTPIRRQVLAALLGSHKALGAYDIIDRLALSGAAPAPITAYRALEFLRANGLVHRIASRNAFIACVHAHSAQDLVVFLICEGCGVVGEASSNEVTATLTSAARGAGFLPQAPVIEISGICTHCRQSAESGGSGAI